MNIFQKLRQYSQIEWLLFLCIIANLGPWFIWGYGLSTLLQYGSVLLLLIAFKSERRLNGKNGTVIFVLLMTYFVLIQIFNTIHFSYIFIVIAYFMALRVTQKEGRNVMNMLTSYIFISIIIPLPLWLMHQYVSPLPLFGTFDISAMKGSEAIMENYLFFVSFQDYEAWRFYSWFDEPGTLGTFAPFVLYANKFNFKDYRIPVILIGCLFTFSMAFIILTLIAWLWCSKKSMIGIIVTISVISIIGYVLYNVLEDNIAFQQSVVERITNPEDNDVESRNTYETQLVWKQTKRNGNLIFGLGSGAMDKYGGIAVSYKSFIIEFGYVGCLLLFIAYYSLIRRRNIESYFALFLFALSFLQRPQLFTVGWFFIFTCVIAMITNDSPVGIYERKSKHFYINQ